jgi:hypothetical protein
MNERMPGFVLFLLYCGVAFFFGWVIHRRVRFSLSRRYLSDAFRLTKLGNQKAARDSVLTAARLDPSLKRITELQNFYEHLVADRIVDARNCIERAECAIRQTEGSASSREVWRNRYVQIGASIFLATYVLMRLLQLFGNP